MEEGCVSKDLVLKISENSFYKSKEVKVSTKADKY